MYGMLRTVLSHMIKTGDLTVTDSEGRDFSMATRPARRFMFSSRPSTPSAPLRSTRN